MAANIHAEVEVAVTPATTAARGENTTGGMEKEEEASIVGEIGLGIFTIIFSTLIYHAPTYVARVLTQAKIVYP